MKIFYSYGSKILAHKTTAIRSNYFPFLRYILGLFSESDLVILDILVLGKIYVTQMKKQRNGVSK